MKYISVVTILFSGLLLCGCSKEEIQYATATINGIAYIEARNHNGFSNSPIQTFDEFTQYNIGILSLYLTPIEGKYSSFSIVAILPLNDDKSLTINKKYSLLGNDKYYNYSILELSTELSSLDYDNDGIILCSEISNTKTNFPISGYIYLNNFDVSTGFYNGTFKYSNTENSLNIEGNFKAKKTIINHTIN